MAGRKPVPAALVNIKKQKKSKEKIKKRMDIEHALETDNFLKCPSHLTKDAKKEWKRVMCLYNKMKLKILSDLDRTAMIMYCEAVSIYNSSQREWKKLYMKKESILDSDEIDLDEVKIIDNLIEEVSSKMNRQTRIISPLTEQLCLSPVGRARIGAIGSKKNDDDELDELEKQKNEAMN